ncbi:MAG: DUF1788 domain-containing protein [Burkholderiaceae bacterium]|nr:DUF1788 domain-containing protein [Burkholderiaceae bacterium]
MSSLNANFEELLARVRYGRELNHASFEPVYYLIFAPKEILAVKREMPAWTARLHNDGWDVHRFSMAEHVPAILQASRLRQLWLSADGKAPLAWDKTNQALANALTTGALQQRLQAQLESLRGKPNAILLITDLEALHPYLRIGSLEGQLAGSFVVPTLIFYPGKRTGKTRLKFLGFYPEDGNYRSVHVGG